MTANLFQRRRLGEDELYARIRDHVRGEPHRQRLEQMWSDYRVYAPRGFRKKFQFEFHQRWWEMYLTLGLHRLGFPISTSSGDDRPDLLLKFGNTKVWIEAVAPTSGKKSDAVPQPVVNGVKDLPMRECLLRFTQAITAKRDAFTCYIQRGIISDADCLVVALSACGLNQFGTLLEWPQPVMLRVLAGAGDLAIPLSGQATAYSKRKNATFRDSGSPVDLALFYSTEFSQVAGVLYSKQDPLNAPAAPEESFEFFLNPKGRAEVPRAITERLATWSEERSAGQEVVWKRTQPDAANEVRPIYRYFAGFIAVMCWLLFILFGISLILGAPLEEGSFSKCIGIVLFALSWSYVAFKGCIPKFFVRLFSRRLSVADEKGLHENRGGRQ